MLSKLKKIVERVANSISRDSATDIEDAGRRRLFAIFLLLLIFPLLVFGTQLIHRNLLNLAFVNYALVVILVSFLIIMRKMRDAKILYRIVLAMLSLLVLYWVNRGAIKGYSSIWVLTLPPFAFYLLGRREGIFWTLAISFLTAIQFHFPALSFYGYVYDKAFVTRHLFALILIVLFTYHYESMRERFKIAMERERLKLNEEKEKLAQAKSEVDTINIKLNEEMVIRNLVEEELRAHRNRLEELVDARTLELQNSNTLLAASESKYRIMTNNITDMIWAMDMNLHFTFFSPAVTRIYGYTPEEAMALSLEQFCSPESLRKIIRIYHQQIEVEKSGVTDPDRHINVQIENLRKDGSVIPVEVAVSFLRNAEGEMVGIIGVTRDISERLKALEENKRIQEQLAQAQKMEAIGTLVGGIAHDFNNILGGIIGSYELLTMLLQTEKLSQKEKIERYLHVGMESSLRSSELIKQLLTLSRKHKISLAPIDINDSLKHVVAICKNSLPKAVEIDFVPAASPLVVMGDMVQIEQVLLNLCINAAHAMTIMRPEGGPQGGILKIRSSEVPTDYRIRDLRPESSQFEGNWVKIDVSDTGIGMDRETVKRIFEPFFTLKKQDEGSGLGLAISYNIIRQHGGLFHVYSEPGRGSSFSLYVPTLSFANGAELKSADAEKIIMGSGTILVIDDEPVILKIAGGFLEASGYQVLTANTGNEGINLYRNKAGEIDAVLVDLSMPGKSGFEVYGELREINKDVRVILASGMLDADSRLNAEKIGIRATVNKPYLAHELSAIVKSVME